MPSAARATYHCYQSTVGPVTLVASGEALCELHFGPYRPQDAEDRPTKETNRAMTELLEYLAGKRRYFDVSLRPAGSAFQQRVWDAIRTIPYAESISFDDLSALCGQACSPSQLSRAAQANPLPIFIPEHRVLLATGDPIGTGIEADRRRSMMSFERIHAGIQD